MGRSAQRPGATSPWLFTAAPFGAEECAMGSPRGPGATSPWLFTAAPFGAEECAMGSPRGPGATSPWLFTAALFGAGEAWPDPRNVNGNLDMSQSDTRRSRSLLGAGAASYTMSA